MEKISAVYMDKDKEYVVMRREDGLPCYYFKVVDRAYDNGVLYKETDFDAPIMWTLEDKLITLHRVDK